jgi:hypothetical protein
VLAESTASGLSFNEAHSIGKQFPKDSWCVTRALTCVVVHQEWEPAVAAQKSTGSVISSTSVKKSAVGTLARNKLQSRKIWHATRMQSTCGKYSSSCKMW